MEYGNNLFSLLFLSLLLLSFSCFVILEITGTKPVATENIIPGTGIDLEFTTDGKLC